MAEDYFKEFDDEVYENGETNKVIKCIQAYNYSSIYGSYSVQSHLGQRFTWTFRIKHNVRNGIYIGISSSYVCDQDCFTNKNSSNYSCASNGNKWSKGTRGKYHSNQFNDGDTLSMTLDCSIRELSFNHNGEDLGTCWEDVDVDESIKYKIAVIMAKKDDEVELIDFRMGDDEESDEVKYTKRINP